MSSLPLCDVIEDEVAALTGRPPAARPSLEFLAPQFVHPVALRRRLQHGRDRVVEMLRRSAAGDWIEALPADPALLPAALAAGFNQLLAAEWIYQSDQRVAFDGVAFRSQTADAIVAVDPPRHWLPWRAPIAPASDLPAIRWRNRLILEDAFGSITRLFDIRLRHAFQQVHQRRITALCLSGGGVRSAAVGLGVLQSLARYRLLLSLDYLSTVSGGGYIGAWLSAWMARTSAAEVDAALRQPVVAPLDPEAAPVRALRQFTSYLGPQAGVLSADSWTLFATWLRNLCINWLAFVPVLIGVSALPRAIGVLISWRAVGFGLVVQQLILGLLVVASGTALVIAVRYAELDRPHQDPGASISIGAAHGQRDFLLHCLAPLMLGALTLTVGWAWGTAYVSPLSGLFTFAPPWLVLAVAGGAVATAGAWSARSALRRSRIVPGPIWFPLAWGAVAGGTIGWMTRFAPPLWALDASERDMYLCTALPAILAVVIALVWLATALFGTRQSDAVREWSARMSAWLLMTIVAWLALTGVILFGPAAVHWLIASNGILDVLIVVASASGIAAAAIAHGSRDDAALATGQAWRSRFAMFLGIVFLAGLLIALGAAATGIIHAAWQWADAVEASGNGAVLIAWAAMVAVFAAGLALSRVIDTNIFSLHALYRMRLIRAWLGASRPDGARDPNHFTGFDDRDNIYLHRLRTTSGAVQRPLHIINATLNLVGTNNLAWQERRAESFTFSALHCGSANVAYRPTFVSGDDGRARGYGGEQGPTLGTAMAISGAAVSPAMGYHSSSVLSLLLAFFDLRLGWWLGNPGHAGRAVWTRSTPKTSLRPIVDEAFGLTNDRHPYVYLSDGGHFDNLGLYEVVLRRCHSIMVIDASADPDRSREDLGNAIRKIRIDLGIAIDMASMAPDDGYCRGTIHYGNADTGAPDGVLHYFKSRLTLDMPADVRAYGASHPDFPDETTADQWFTESQFESYRALGSALIDGAMARHGADLRATMAPTGSDR